jgi:hypothetical protein
VVDVLEHLGRVALGRGGEGAAQPGGELLRVAGDAGEGLLVEDAVGQEPVFQAGDGVLVGPGGDLVGAAVAGVVVGVGVRLDAVGEGFDDGGAAAGAGAVRGPGDGGVDGRGVVAVDAHTGRAVAGGLVGEGAGGGLFGEGDADRVLVVLDQEDDGRAAYGRVVDGFVEVALAGGAVADVGEGDGVVAAHAGGVGESGGVQALGGQRGALGGGAVGVRVVAAVAVAPEEGQDLHRVDAAGEQGDALAVGGEEPVGGAQGEHGRGLAGFLAAGGGVDGEAALPGEGGGLPVEGAAGDHGPVQRERGVGGQRRAAGCGGRRGGGGVEHGHRDPPRPRLIQVRSRVLMRAGLCSRRACS